MLGAFDNPEELDRPDLNKCPDCECLFAGDSCPICGKICPEEMRAGNRKPPKEEKRRRSRSFGRVTFIEWYYSWWFITLMTFFMPLVGIILLAKSPYEKRKKVTFIVLACVYWLISLIGVQTIINTVSEIVDPPVIVTLREEEYVARCEDVSAEEVWRSPKEYKDKCIKITVEISSTFEDVDSYSLLGKYNRYYVCRIDGTNNYILIRNCILDGECNFNVGDTVTFYGEGAGMKTVYNFNYDEYSAPCVNAAYADLIG